MTIPVSIKKNTPTAELLPDGAHTAVLYRMVQIGSVEETFKQQTKLVKKVLLSFVIPSVTRLINEQPAPYIVHRLYTESLYETAHLRRDLIKMVGRDFLTQEAESATEYDLTDLIGLSCLITTRQRYVKPGLTLVEIEDYGCFPDDELTPEYPLPLQFLSFRDFNWVLFLSLSRRLRTKIESSREYQRFTPEQIAQGLQLAASGKTPDSDEDQDGDLPF